MSRRHRLALVAILLLAAGLRAGWVGLAQLDPFDGEYYDMAFYHVTAVQLANGNGYTRLDGAATAVWPPGYPALLAGIYALTDHSTLAGKLANALFGLLTTLFTYGIARLLAGPGAGLVAALLIAACPDDIFYANFLMSEPAFGALFTGVLCLFVWLEKRRPDARAGWLGLGVLLGLAALTRGIALAWLAVPLLAWVIAGRIPRPALLRAALLVVGLALALLPWTLRNWNQMGEPILLATSLGRTLAHAHGPFETGDDALKAFVWRQQVTRQYEHLPFPEREITLNQEFTRLALDHALNHPGDEIGIAGKRFAHFVSHGHQGLEIGRPKLEIGRPKLEIGQPRLEPGGRRPVFGASGHAWLAGVADVLFYALLSLGILGVPGLLRGRDPAALVVPFTMAYFTLLHTLIFPGDPRYHVPILPLLAVSAATWIAVRRRRADGTRDASEGVVRGSTNAASAVE